jgi:hypothetical protein
VTCRYCNVAGYLAEDGWDGYALMWHKRCKGRGCGCEHGKRRSDEKGERVSVREPHFGRTRHGLAVHARTADHLPGSTAVARFNSRLGVAITGAVGSMWAAYAFALLALGSLPAILTQAFRFHVFPPWLINASLIDLVAWVSSYFLQLVLLPIIIVGQNVQSQAADARAAKTFEDVELVKSDLLTALDRLDVTTEGGIKAILDAVNALASQVTAPAPAKRLATRAEQTERTAQ